MHFDAKCANVIELAVLNLVDIFAFLFSNLRRRGDTDTHKHTCTYTRMYAYQYLACVIASLDMAIGSEPEHTDTYKRIEIERHRKIKKTHQTQTTNHYVYIKIYTKALSERVTI